MIIQLYPNSVKKERKKEKKNSAFAVFNTYRLCDCGFADLIGFVEDFSVQVVQNCCRVTDAGKVHHGFYVPERKLGFRL